MKRIIEVPSIDVINVLWFLRLFPQKRGSNNLELIVIEDEKARFIRLFGVEVDLNTGNIAFGMFPDPDEYIYIDNLYEIISKQWFGKKKSPKNIDLSYIVELLKLDPDFYQLEIEKEVSEDLKDSIEIKDSKSIMVTLMREKMGVSNEESDSFNKVCTCGKVIYPIAEACINIYLKCSDVSRSLYQSYISEESDVEVREAAEYKFDPARRGPNIESLTLSYISKGVPSLLLHEAKSYGYRVKERLGIFNKGTTISMAKYSPSDIIDIGKALSSMFYARRIMDREAVLAYNFIDMLRSIGWEQNIYFALDTIVEYKSKAVWESLMNRFHMYDILNDMHLSETRLVQGITSYRGVEMPKVQSGACYGRFTTLTQYKFVSYSIHQIKEAGMVFESTFTLLKKFI